MSTRASNDVESSGISGSRGSTLQSPARVEGYKMTKTSQQFRVPQEKNMKIMPSQRPAFFGIAAAVVFASALALAPVPAFAQHGGGGGGGGSHGGGGRRRRRSAWRLWRRIWRGAAAAMGAAEAPAAAVAAIAAIAAAPTAVTAAAGWTLVESVPQRLFEFGGGREGNEWRAGGEYQVRIERDSRTFCCGE